MALKRNETYPGRFSNPTDDHPQGAFKNRSAPGAQDGSYLEQQWANDWDGFFGRLLTLAGVTPNGNVDTASTSQYYDALKSLFLQRANPFADIKSDGTVNTALENLGLGTAAQKDVGNSANQIPDMGYFTIGQTSSGRWAKLPSGLIIQAGTGLTGSNGTASVNLPIPFTGTFSIVGGSIEGNGPIFVSARGLTQSTIGVVAWGRDGSIQVTNMCWLAIGV